VSVCVAVQEAIATGDPEMVQVCLQYREAGRNTRRTAGVPDLLQRLTEVSIGTEGLRQGLRDSGRDWGVR
jgi:hypothetical protein